MPENRLWFLWWRPKHAYLCELWARKGVVGYLKMVVFETHHAKKIVWVPGWRPKHADLCTLWA